MFPKIAKPVTSDLHPFIQSSWRNRIGLLRQRRGLGITGTGNLACNVINNTVNTTVQQCILNSMIIICLAIWFQSITILFKSIQFNSIQFKAYSSSLKEAFNLCSSPLKRAFNSLYTLYQVSFRCPLAQAEGAPFTTQRVKNSFHFNITHFIKWLFKCVGFTSVLIRDHRHHYGAPERSIYCSRLNLSYITVFVHFSSFLFISLHFIVFIQYIIQ